MSLTIQLTDEQAEKLAADILKLHKPDAPPALPSKTARRKFFACIEDASIWDFEYQAIAACNQFQSKPMEVREVLPGDPTPEQVQALVRTIKNAFTLRATNHPTWEAEAKAALSPFQKH